jgi:type IV secretion system protein VirD4
VPSEQSGVDDDALEMLMLIGAGLACVAYALSFLVWLAGQLSGFLVGNGWPDSGPGDVFSMALDLVSNPTSRRAAWPQSAQADLGPAWLHVMLALILFVPVGVLIKYAVQFRLNWRRRREFRLFRLGFASGYEVRKHLGRKAVLAKAKSVRPSVAGQRNLKPTDVGFHLGRDKRSRTDLYASVEDVMIVLAPPRQGKDVHFCTPYTIDAPGPCIVTSTRSDAFTNTRGMRAEKGNIFVFDPNDMTGWHERLRWSPIRGCEKPLAAQNRAAALMAGSGLTAEGEFAFFYVMASNILRGFLHAAALGGKSIRDIQRWVNQQVSPEPIEILHAFEASGHAAPGWAANLESLSIAAEPRRRGNAFANVALALGCFADPKVMDACSPGPDEQFDIAGFLSGQNTLYVLGKSAKDGSVAGLVTAMMEDLFDAARGIASGMPGSRLDPPLTVELNEAAHIAPMPNLPEYMGDSGGFSIALHVYLQSLSQARAKWGEHEAMIMWDNAAVRVIMGGAGNVNDLEDISRIMGEYEAEKTSTTTGGKKTETTSTSARRVLSAEEIRTLKFGTAVVVARASRPVEVELTPWWKRKDGGKIAGYKKDVEQTIMANRKRDAQNAKAQRSISPLGPTVPTLDPPRSVGG